jgi:hypothetical protein
MPRREIEVVCNNKAEFLDAVRREIKTNPNHPLIELARALGRRRARLDYEETLEAARKQAAETASELDCDG